jgi:hypothetical protein
MKIKYSQHIDFRIKMRKINYDLPSKIFQESQERYHDRDTGYFIAIQRVKLYDKSREVMVAYDQKGEEVTLLTVHPLKEGQKENRVENGRWRII